MRPEREPEALIARLILSEGQKFFSREDTDRLLAALGKPQNAAPSIHIAGTNGKGSVGAMLAAIISAAGNTVGHTSSPHLCAPVERCLIDGVPCEKDRFYAAVSEVVSAAEKLDLHPSAFVLLLAASFLVFAERRTGWLVIEAGLGGADDATNLLSTSRASAITSIGYDHVDILGSTLEAIAAVKAGIAKPGVPMFVGEVPGSVRDTIREVAAHRGAPVHFQGIDFVWDEAARLLRADKDYELDLSGLALAGAYQRRNAVLAARTAYALGFSPAEIHRGLSTVRWPGRCELFELSSPAGPVPVLLDVAHNEEGMAALRSELDLRERNGATPIFIVSMLDRKDYSAALGRLANSERASAKTDAPGAYPAKHDGLWICTSSGHSHARHPEELERFLASLGETAKTISDPRAALQDALSAAGMLRGAGKGNPLLVVTGSVYLVSKIRPLLTEQPVRTIAG